MSRIAKLLALTGLAAVVVGLVFSSQGTAQQKGAESDRLKENFLIEHEIGHRYQISPDHLPAPKSGPVVTNRSLTIPFSGQTLQVPRGFSASLFASGLANPRRLLVLPNGDVLVAEQGPGYLTLLRDAGSGKASWIERHVEDLNNAWRNGEVLVADQDGIWSVPHVLGGLRAGRPSQQRAEDVPREHRKPTAGAYGAELITQKGVFGIVQGHQNRHLAIDTKTGALFVGVGSSGNIRVEPEPKATIQRFEKNGSSQSTYASGTRNPTALAFEPTSGDLYAVVQERDGLGDDLPSDYLIRVQQGAFYGWPYAYIGPHPQPGFAQLAPDKVNATIPPDLLFEAHSSTLDLVFYTGDQFPPEYKNGVFVALKGSWNRSIPTGYKVVFLPFQNGRPAGYYENFATGFWSSGLQRAEVWGRPAALAVAKDGSLLVADDTGGTIWRISYSGQTTAPDQNR
jgi:glucose/arabinose dehydrogenase